MYRFILILAFMMINLSCDQKNDHAEVAVFSAGCFWGVQHTFREFPGVLSTRAGYMGADQAPQSHFSARREGNVEVVEILFDPKLVTYEKLVESFFKTTKPKLIKADIPNQGRLFRGRVFFIDQKQRSIALKYDELFNKERNILTQILPVKNFYLAEEEQQHWYHKRGKEPACLIP